MSDARDYFHTGTNAKVCVCGARICIYEDRKSGARYWEHIDHESAAYDHPAKPADEK